MKIEQLSIQNFRGIVDLTLDLHSENALIVGPNGVGKSAVADAIDFLLTGDVTRLTGKGTGDISIAKHGPHVGTNPKEAIVSAIIKSRAGDSYTVKRTVVDKDKIKVDEKHREDFQSMVSYSRNGAHFLSRRELLKFILVTPGDRSIQIQTLLICQKLKL